MLLEAFVGALGEKATRSEVGCFLLELVTLGLVLLGSDTFYDVFVKARLDFCKYGINVFSVGLNDRLDVGVEAYKHV